MRNIVISFVNLYGDLIIENHAYNFIINPSTFCLSPCRFLLIITALEESAKQHHFFIDVF